MSNFFWNNIFKQNKSEVEVIAELWQQTPLFKNIPFRHIHALSENMHIRNYQQDEVVFRVGDQSVGAILLLQGQINISTHTATLAEL